LDFASPFPYWQKSDESLRSGYFIPLPAFCNKKRARCFNYYYSIMGKSGFHTCPYGLASYISDYFPDHIFTGMRIQPHFDRGKTKRIDSEVFSPVIPASSIEKGLSAIHAEVTNNKFVESRLSESELQNRAHLSFINETIHEIRSLNASIKSQAQELAWVMDNGADDCSEKMKYLQRNLFETSSLVTMRLNAFDFHSNPELVFGKETKLIEIHKKFHKISHCLRIASRREHARINLHDNCNSAIRAHDIFDMLPFVLLDNAIKYTPKDNNIYVTFFEDFPKLSITVSSFGPTLSAKEREIIFKKSTRGMSASKLVAGSGLGLNLAKLICDQYNIEISVDSDPPTKKIGKIPYSRFLVTLKFPEDLLEYVKK
jgi:Histidine kinase-, DNA gyrase B-, and HSP90-like ATPase